MIVVASIYGNSTVFAGRSKRIILVRTRSGQVIVPQSIPGQILNRTWTATENTPSACSEMFSPGLLRCDLAVSKTLTIASAPAVMRPLFKVYGKLKQWHPGIKTLALRLSCRQ